MWSYDPQAFLLYNQISNKHPSQYRKLYWYPTRMPTMPTQKQRVGKFVVTHGYASVREHSPYNGLQIRYLSTLQLFFAIKNIEISMGLSKLYKFITLF